jgi:hypothetical protein
MNEESPNVCERILAIFESVREVPGAAYDAEYLVQYLINNPERKIELHNTFKGKRKFNRFMRTIEGEYTICFSLKDHELVSLRQWVDRVTYLRSTPKSSLATIANRMKDRPPDMLALAIAVVSFPVVAIGYRLFGVSILLVLVLPIAVTWLLYRSHWQELRFYSEMQEKIRSRSGTSQKPIG